MGKRVAKAARRIVTALPTIGIIVDARGRVVKASKPARAARLIRHRRLADERLAALVRQARAAGHTQELSVAVPSAVPGKTPAHLSVRAVPADGHGNVAILADDRSRQHRVEAMRRDFLANVGHELKTPISAVGLLAEALQAAYDDPARVKGFAARLQQESARLGRLVQDVLELSRLESTDADEAARPCRIDGVVAAAVDAVRVQAQAARVPLVVGAPTGAWVFGDPRILATAISNLLSNAIRVSPQGEPVSVVTAVEHELVTVAVSDHGPGIAETELPRVFERFYRTDRSRSRDTGGTGLGLAIVKHAADTHGGDVRVTSSPGEGSTFTVRLPLSDPDTTGDKDNDEDGAGNGGDTGAGGNDDEGDGAGAGDTGTGTGTGTGDTGTDADDGGTGARGAKGAGANDHTEEAR
ncbi:MAG TPA: ATP-binding protein [Microbacteriaceae bacterium]|nr:ATP-binding protein [Microbacteriaceae bacterium]